MLEKKNHINWHSQCIGGGGGRLYSAFGETILRNKYCGIILLLNNKKNNSK